MLLRNTLFAWLAVCCLPLSFFAQDQRCHTTEYQEMVEAQDPDFVQQRALIDAHADRYEQQAAHNHSSRTDEVITIPVVVHILYSSPVENLSEAQVLSQIRILNEDFRRFNADTSNTPAMFQGVAADTKIEFCLADVDPDGQPTDGITRTPTTTGSFGLNNQIKFNSSGGKDAWPTSQYMNFWVGDITGGILGYAQFPGGNPATDGIVVDYLYFGDIGTTTPPYNLGRTATHEVGHWLNLRHIWGDGGCGQDDLVGDTPLAGGSNFTGLPCSFPGPNSCNTGMGDQPDMFQNYMDYSDDACMNLYTQGQTTRMEALFAPGGFRASLLESVVCCPPTTCPRVSNLTATSPNDSVALVSWGAIDTAQSYLVEYRPLGTNNWLGSFSTTDSTFEISNLDLCSEYEVRVSTICSSDSSTFCQLIRVETEGCCRAPEEDMVVPYATDSALLSWEVVYGTLQFDVRYRLSGTSNAWTLITVQDTSVVLGDLLPCQSYEYQIKPKCDIFGNLYSELSQFFSPGCEACTEADYCTPDANNGLVYIESFSFGNSISEVSGNNDGYGFFANTSTDVLIDSSYTFTFSRGGTATLATNWKAWLDLNGDGDFLDGGEMIFESGSTADPLIQGQVTLSQFVGTGRTRLRIATKYIAGSSDPLISCDTIGTGEYEDYCLNLVAPCRRPENFNALYDSAGASIFLQWFSPFYSDTFAIQYQVLGDTTWTTVPGSRFDFFEFADSSLANCTEYVFRSLAACENSQELASAPDTIKTACLVSIESALAASIRLFPNPTQGSWVITAPQLIESVEVVDLMGRKVLQAVPTAQRVELSLTGEAGGVYLVRIQTAAGSVVKRLLYRP